MKSSLATFIISLVFVQTFGQTRNSLDDGRKIIIPIVFHVLYANGVENISEASILNELQDLNKDFSATNDMNLLDNSFKNYVGNPNIEFVLLDKSLQGDVIHGIRRIDAKKLKDRKALLIDPENCVNVFIADQGNNSNIFSDRVNLNYKDIGTHSHVLTHETGHWLGLYHIFGQIGNSSTLRVVFGNHDDLIDDTPFQKKGTALCYVETAACPCPPSNIYCKGHKTMFNSFMDYNPCRCMFSIGQSTQMRNGIILNKPKLFSRL